MMVLLYVLARTGQVFLGLIYSAMFLRAILSWFIRDEESVLMGLLAFVTEPAIIPVRSFLMRFRFVQQCPIDLSFMATFMLIFFLQQALPVPTL